MPSNLTPKPTKPCEECGTAFAPKDGYAFKRQRFCSNACRLDSLHRYTAALKQSPEFTCEWCGKAYRRPPSGSGKYCSQKCTKAAQRPPLDAVWDRVDRTGGTAACWPWLGNTNAYGYGTTHVGNRFRMAHRAAYEASKNTIPTGHVLHHTCENKLCCNPGHLQPMTRDEHMNHHRVTPLPKELPEQG